jgi:hypothetical protein
MKGATGIPRALVCVVTGLDMERVSERGSFKMRSTELEDMLQGKIGYSRLALGVCHGWDCGEEAKWGARARRFTFLVPAVLSPLHVTATPDMVLLVTTDRILAAFETVPASRRQELDLPATLELHGPIAHEQIIRLSKHLRHDAEYNATQDTNRSPTILSALLCGTKVYVPPPPKKPEPVRVMLAIAAKQAH